MEEEKIGGQKFWDNLKLSKSGISYSEFIGNIKDNY